MAEEDDSTRTFLAQPEGRRLPGRIGPRALALLYTAHPDLIVVGVNGQTLKLPDTVGGGEGIAVRADPDTPVIVLSRDGDRLQRERSSA